MEPLVIVAKRPTKFVASVRLNGAQIGRDTGCTSEEISTLPGAQLEVTLEVHVRVPDGVKEDVVRTVTENANTLGFEHASFEE